MNELASIAEQNYRITCRQVESVQSIEEIRHPVVRAVLQHFEVSARLNIATFSDLPGGTGLGSSSAFTVGMISLIAEYLGLKLSPEESAKKAFFID